MKKFELVINRIMDLIRSEMLRDGERLPSVRFMSKQMGVSVATVLEAYLRLEAKGVIKSRPQSGYYLQLQACRNDETSHESENADSAQNGETVRSNSVIEYPTHIISNETVPFGSPLADMRYFPNEALSFHISRIARTYPELINNYSVEKESNELVEVILKWMMNANCVAQKNEVVVTSGGTQALMLALRVLCEPGDTVAVESPGYRGFFYLFDFLKLNAHEIPSDPQDGLSVEALEKDLENGLRPACLLLSSNFSNPTGALMPPERKQALVKLCSKYNLPIIEDDTFGELYFTGQRPIPLKALWPEDIIYVGNFSKILAPGYRVAWLAGGQYTPEIRRYLDITVRATPMLVQMALASFINEGGLKQHLLSIRKQYGENMQLFRNKVLQSFPEGTRATGPKGGQHIWVELPRDHDSVKLYTLGQKDGISTSPGILFSSGNHYKNCLRLNCCARKWDADVEKAIERLGRLVRFS